MLLLLLLDIIQKLDYLKIKKKMDLEETSKWF
jgi:hypothetical protein